MQRMLLRHLSNLRLFPALVALLFAASLCGACSSSHDPADAGDTHATATDAGDGIAAPETAEDVAPDVGVDVPIPCYGDNPLVITELQIHPCEYAIEEEAEWFEVRNLSDEDVDIRGWTIRDTSGQSHAIPTETPILVPAGSFFVFAASALEGADYVYDGIRLTNGEDDLELLDHCGARVDMVAWDARWPPRECASIQLTSSAYDPLLNDDYRYWCESPGTSGDPASMGASNTKCAGFCGDGEQDDGEECDEGEDNNSDTEPDACRTDCKAAWCGDGVQDEDEECDDGEEGNSDTLADACRTDCKAAWCGDGVRDEDEQCDDGVDGSESCSPACERLCTLSPGDVILTEIMRNSADENDDGEYIELLNTTAAPVDLVGCVLRDADSDSHEICVPSLTIAAGARIVLARSALAEENGGLEPDYTYGGLTHGGSCSGGSFQMSNTEDEVILDCCGVVVDEVAYDDVDGWPDEAAYAMSLSPDSLDAESNDAPENWCSAPADTPYGDGSNFGTPGLPNAECYASVDWCMIDRPSTAELRAGESFTVYVLFREEGATDVTTGIDEIAGLAVELGVGAGGSLPGDAWSWVSAEANAAWIDQISPDADQYLATFETTEPGDFDYAFRVSLDDGDHWVYCDGRGGAGANGSEDGYSPENAGELTVLQSPCENNPCTPPPADVCEEDGFTLRDYSNAPGNCTPDGDSYTCEYDYLLTDCRLEGGRCEDGACAAYPVASFGQVVITEIMYDPHFDLEEDDAEWFELYNNSDRTVTLNGCVVRDDSNHTTLVVGLSLEPMDYALFVRSDDTTVNGGLEPDHLFDFALLNDGGTLQLQCPDDSLVLQLVDSVTYDDGGSFPGTRAASISLSRNAYGESYNDNGANWCLAESAYFIGSITPEMDNLGTPGAPNPLCPAPDRAVDWCRLQGPLQLEASAGLPVSFTGRVFEEGVTDTTDGVDPGPEPGMRGQVGYGLDGTSPETATDDWTWIEAEPTEGWDASLAEPGLDEYTATLLTPPEGTYDVAFRFTLDNGVNWLYCDRDTGLLGEDGSENLYQIANAGSLETLQSPCSPSPCVTPPDPICTEDGEDAIAYLPNGVCSIVGNEPVCAFESEIIYCSESGGHCEDGSCVDEAPMPFEAGQVVFSEIMYNPHYDLSDTYAEWFELYNAGDETLYLEGCLVTDEGGGLAEVTNLLLDPGAYGLFVATVSYADNGNLFADQTFPFALGNSGDSLYLECDGLLIDAVSYDVGGDYPEAEARSLNLGPDALDAGLNDVASNWCLATEVYYEGGGASEDNYGTPGSANSACPVVDTEIDWCRLQYPLDADEPAAAQFTVYGRVHELGITDQSTGSDAHPMLDAQVGWGPDGSDPTTTPGAWTWSDAEANTAWVDTEEPGNDEYVGSFTTPSAGSYDFAYRFSRDGGTTWTYCDRDAGDGMDGSEDGYQTAQAGALTTSTSPCESLDCTTPPDPDCAVDGVTVQTYSGPGSCVVAGDSASCVFPQEDLDCSVEGGICNGGACWGLPDPPAVGDVIFTEILYDPGVTLADANAEWFEIRNVVDADALLTGCLIEDGGGNQVVIDRMFVAAGEHALFVRSDVDNGGLVPDHLFSFGLNNTGDTLTLSCEGTVIDTVTYLTDDPFPTAARASFSLDPERQTATDNDIGSNWCVADEEQIYYEGEEGPDDDHFGTPGALNAECDLPDFVVDWCRLEYPLTALISSGTPFTFTGRVYEQDITDRSSGNDPDPALLAQGGYGTEGTDPTNPVAEWFWFDAEPTDDWNDGAEPDRDEYGVVFSAPAPGGYDYAFRFSLDGGENWLYCDRNAGLGQDGSVDGYSPANAGALTTISSPCEDFVCDSPNPPICNDATSLIVYESPGQCSLFSREPRCEYSYHIVDCAESGGYCSEGACVGGWEIPEAGDLVFSELMVDTEGDLLEQNAEWFELVNVSDRDLQLEGCVVSDTSTATLIFDPLLVLPGHYVLAARSDEGNGDLDIDAVFPLGLNNTGDTLSLHCGDTLIDTVTYDDGPGFPFAKRYSMALDPRALDASLNDVGANWCLADSSNVYWAGVGGTADDHYGTPGYANSECPDMDADVDWCRLQAPESAELPPGESLVVYGRMYEMGLTDATAGVDSSPSLVAQAGYGSAGSDPRAAPETWSWASASPTPGWNGSVALPVPEPEFDEYVAALPVPEEQATYGYAFRFSLDGGSSWLYCDLDTGIDGEDGSENGYQVVNAGQLISLEPETPCNPNPCLDPPTDLCGPDGLTLITYAYLGQCEVVEDAAVCSYPPILVDCSEDGGYCEDAACVYGPQPPAVGDVVITEIMVDPRGDLLDAMAEWFEIHNPTTKEIDLDGCRVLDAGGASSTIYDFVLQPGDYAVFGRTDFAALNGGLEVDAMFGFSLNNDGDSITLECDGAIIDIVYYTEQTGFTVTPGASFSLDPGYYDAAANDQGWAWCPAEDVYYVDPVSSDRDNYGTPGEPNAACPEQDVFVDWCRLDRPLDETVLAGADFSAYALVLEAGVTDATSGYDPTSLLIGQFGYGPAGTSPSLADSSWFWYDATGNPDWDDTSLPGADEYASTFPAPTAGNYDFAFRFSRNAGINWLYCDRDAGDGADGSEDGYTVANAGHLLTEANACFPNPCFTPWDPECDVDGVTLITYGAGGTCTLEDASYACDYPATTTDCSLTGGVCSDGACVGSWRAPAAGDLFFTEIMATPDFDLEDASAEWFEITNGSDDLLQLAGCTIADDSGAEVNIVTMAVEAGESLLFARSEDTGLNGGLTPNGTFAFELGDTSDSLTLRCGDEATVIDAVAYDVSADFPEVAGASLSLSHDAYDATSNDDGANWCEAGDVYYVGTTTPEEDNYGTPGLTNPVCPEIDLTIDWCRLQWPLDEQLDEGSSLTVYGRVFDDGVTNVTDAVDYERHLVAELGFGPDGTAPSESGSGWLWVTAAGNPEWNDTDEPGNDEYMGSFTVPDPGQWDFAFRFSLDDGETWTYCDRDAGDGFDGSEDGYAAANAGQLESLDSPCLPNPCTTPDPDGCDVDGVTALLYPEVGECSVDGDSASCVYTPDTFDCSHNGGTCDAGVCVGGELPNFIFSQYVEGTGSNQALEIYNAGDYPAPLSAWSVFIYPDGSGGADLIVPLSGGELAAGAVTVVCHSDFAQLTSCDLSSGDLVFDGDDAVGLAYNGQVKDLIGKVGEQPASGWGTAPTSTMDATLTRDCGVSDGHLTLGEDVFDPADQWTSAAVDTFDGLGEHCAE